MSTSSDDPVVSDLQRGSEV